MKKITLLALAVIAHVSANEIDNAFKSGTFSGQLRGAHVNQNNAASTDTYGTAIGGQLKYETGTWHGVRLGVAAFISEKMNFASGDADKSELNSDLFDLNGDSYAYLGEGYVDYTADDYSLRIGRQKLSTPFADTDDIRMQPNTHEAAILTYNGIDHTTLTGGFITRWAGYDYSVTDKTHFQKPAEGSHGAAVFGIKNESIENLVVQGWYYSIDKMTDIGYIQANYGIKVAEDVKIDMAVQYANFAEDYDASVQLSGTDGDVYGAMVSLNSGMLTAGVAYNEVHNKSGKTVNLGLGGGPFFTSMWEWTLGWMEDAKAYQLNAAFDLKDLGLNGLTLSTLYGDFRSDPTHARVSETDIVMLYQASEAFIAEVNFASIRDHYGSAGSNGSDAGYDRLLVRLSYNF